MKRYLIILVKQAVHRGRAETVVASVPLWASATSAGRDRLPNGDILETLLPQKSAMNTTQSARGKEVGWAAKCEEYFVS